ncbi:MAG: ATP-grasp domain-containing protein [bacterium]|nr:MAG: ATP-grasp domain-containing protein [bacterium]
MINLNEILILTSGNITKLEGFGDKGVMLGTFKEINYDSNSNELKLNDTDLKNYKVIYFRMVGKSLEVATLVSNYASENGIKVVDVMYEKTRLMPISLGKSLEMRKLYQSGITIPRTVFGDFSKLKFPYVVKSTSGQKAREVWLVNNQEELELLNQKLDKQKLYFAQELVPNAERIRVLVIGDRAIGAIKRQTKWNKSQTKETLDPIPDEIARLAVDSAKAVELEISGIDILVNSQTNEMCVIEANAAPAWKLINKYCNASVEDEIIKYLQTKI